MAVVAFGRAIRYGAVEQQAAGVSCTAGLATDRPKRGPHRAHVAVQTSNQTRYWSLDLEKEARSRQEEEQIVSRMVLNAVAAACGVDERLDLPLLEQERLEIGQVTAPPPWQELFLGRFEAIKTCPHRPGTSRRRARGKPSAPRVILSGAFNPLHEGHRRMAEIAEEVLGLPTAMEISILNVDKPALDYLEIDRRLGQFPPEQSVWLTRAATFDDKSRLFPGATFVVGVDTLRRIADLRYYGNDRNVMLQSLQRIIGRNCRFLVFGRAVGSSFIRLADLDLPDAFGTRAARFRRRSSARMCRQRRCEKKVSGKRRNPKHEIRNKSEIQRRKLKRLSFEPSNFLLWICLGFRDSDFGFLYCVRCPR